MKRILVFLALCAIALPALAGDRVLFLVGKEFNRGEFWTSYHALQAAGYTVDVAGVEQGPIPVSSAGPRPEDAPGNLTLDAVDPTQYVGLVIPGGYGPGNLEKYPRTLEICTAFMQANKPVAAICHGPRLLMRAGLMKGRVGTCLNSVANELCDAWVAGEYGKYLDQPVVIDGNLVTSRYPNDVIPFSKGAIEVMAQAGGLPLVRKQASVLVISSAIQRNDKWDLTEIPKIFGVTVKVVASAKEATDLMAAPGFDLQAYNLLVVPDAQGTEKLLAAPEVKKLVGDAKAAGRGILASANATAALKEAGIADGVVTFNGDLGPLMHEMVVRVNGPAAEIPLARPTAVIELACAGFSELDYAAARVFLTLEGKDVGIAGPEAGWYRGVGGLPVRATMRSDVAHQGNLSCIITLGRPGAYKVSGDNGVGVRFSRFYGAATVMKTPGPNPTAAIALREGFDDQVYLEVLAYLRYKGYDVITLGPKQGTLRGMNGLSAEVHATYDDVVNLAKDAIIVAPGGIWPMKAAARQATQPAWIEEQDKRDQTRLNWLVARWQAGAMLVTFGFDSLNIGTRAEFKGKAFASSDQTVWSFGKDGGRYSGDRAVRTDTRIISAKGFDCVGDALTLLEAPRAQ